MSYTVLYMNAGATRELVSIIGEQLPAGWELLVPGQSCDLAAGLLRCDFLLVPEFAVTAEIIDAAPKLRLVQHQGVGYEKIDLAACRRRGVPVALAPEGTSVGVAEHTILLILALFKHLVAAASATREGRWPQWELRNRSYELAGKQLGLVGLGRIGREVAKRALAFDARVSYFDPWAAHADDMPIQRIESFDDLLREADIVSLHVPLTQSNRGLIDSRALGLMKPSAVLVNTSRGGLVDEPALVAALRSRKLAAAALDVLVQEPPAADNPLLHMDNVLVTPHISAGTRDALVAKMRAAFANMVRHTRGEALANVVHELADLPAARGNANAAGHARA